jgi:hypothetical protein
MTLNTLFSLAMFVVLGACTGLPGSSSGGSGDRPDASRVVMGDGGFVYGPDAAVVEGTVRRTVDLARGKDGRGTLCVAISDHCPSLAHQEPVGYVGLQVNDADLSSTAMEVRFAFDATGLAHADYVVSGYLKEEGGECTGNPARDDPVSFHIVAESPCPSFSYRGQGMSGLVLDLNYLMPF